MKIIHFTDDKAIVNKDDDTHFFTVYTHKGWSVAGNKGHRVPNFISRNEIGEILVVTNVEKLTIDELEKIGKHMDTLKNNKEGDVTEESNDVFRCFKLSEQSPVGLYRHPSVSGVLQFFKYAHLPAHLQEISKPVAELALSMADTLPENPELTVGLRKLLEAKDCFVRAKLYK